jgi:arylsulfatase A-like enzyme
MNPTTNRREFLRGIGCGVAALGGLSGFDAHAGSAEDPNIIFMVADNLGRESVGFYPDNSTDASEELKINTPRIDRLASEGVIFDNCLIGTPLCGPARCGWNTGRHAYRVGLNSQTSPSNLEGGLSAKEVTLAQTLKTAGYDTALRGKWNLGYGMEFNPTYRGFDTFYGSLAGNADYYTHVYGRSGERHFYRDTTPINDEGYFDKLFTNEALKFLKGRKGNPAPFYLNLTFYAPHGPYQAPPGYEEGDPDTTNYKNMVEYLDLCVGRVVDEVERLGMAENTLIVFLSDQGSSSLNDYGRTLSEGGLKVICAARLPGKIPAGRRVATPWLHLDLFAVFAGIAGAEAPRDRVMDAENVWPLFEGREMARDRTFCWTYQEEDAIRIGDVKLRMKDGKVLGLYDLAADPDEKKDLASEQPGRVKEMIALQATWKKECEAQQTSTT